MSSLPVNLVVEFHLIWQTVNLKRNHSKKGLVSCHRWKVLSVILNDLHKYHS